MPRVDPAEYESLRVEARGLVEEFALHDVWLVELEGAASCTVPELRRLITPENLRTLNLIIRSLFSLRSALGRAFNLESTSSDAPARQLRERVPLELANTSEVPPGTREGPFEVLYVLPDQAAYQVLNATVHAVVVVALVAAAAGQRLFWATYIKPVGRITPLYMRVIDPFRRAVVYPGLEAWLKRIWLEGRGAAAA